MSPHTLIRCQRLRYDSCTVKLQDFLLAEPTAEPTIPLWLISESELAGWRSQLAPAHRSWLQVQAFAAERMRVLLLPDEQGGIAAAAMGVGSLKSLDELTLWHAAGLPDRLPAGHFVLQQALSSKTATAVVLGWIHGAYRLNRFRSAATPVSQARLIAPSNADVEYAMSAGAALHEARDLINAPANELGPAELARCIESVARRFGASCEVIADQPLMDGYPMVHAVGRASVRDPRLVDLRWGDPAAPRVTLVGKGVCFDSGGLDLKPSAGMLLMKKDMGGAAVALATARMLMELRAPIRLRLLVPAVENSVAGSAYRPGDVLRSRGGLTVEVNNTDAEGRLILADALAEADSEQPDLLLDFATLTGAARVALGPELPAVFSPDDTLLQELRAAGDAECDPVWPLPLWQGYDDELASKVADLSNVSSGALAGAIIGALFLRRFVKRTTAWAHFDLHAWNTRDRPGRPVGAEAQCARLAYRLIRARFG